MRISSEQEMAECGKKLAEKVKSVQDFAGRDGSVEVASSAVVVELVGDVGAGKTTLTRGLAEGLGVKEPVTSPSFTISKVYALPGGGRLVHYDFYRLGEPGLMAEDLQENLAEPGNVVVVEWGESVGDLLPKERVTVRVEYNDDGTREVTVSGVAWD